MARALPAPPAPMPLPPNAISEHLRSHKPAISDAWEAAIRAGLPELARLDRSARVDHIPEFLDGLASWVEGSTEDARVGFEALVQGHAIQRLGYGVELRTLTREYSLLRIAILRELHPVVDAARYPDLIRLEEGMDEAVHAAVGRYAEARDQVRDRFVGILAHDLRNPMNAVLMGATRITSSKDEGLQRVGLAIQRSGERMVRMINDLLDFTRGQLAGGIPVVLAAADLGEIAHEVVAELGHAHPARDLRIAVTGALYGAFDRDRVIQALSNLVGNALEHGADPVEVAVAEAPDRRALVTTVTSHGPPIPTAELARMFDPFRVASQARRAGLGLGLYIVQQIALAHGATCSVTSSAAAGTAFAIRWPRTRADEAPDYR